MSRRHLRAFGALSRVAVVALVASGLTFVGATSASAAVGTISAAASCQAGGGAQVVLTYSNPDSYSMYANGGFGEPTADFGFSDDTITEGPMAGETWGLFYEGTATSVYDGGGFSVASGTASKTFTIEDGANGGSINFGFFVKAGAEQNSYIPRQDITVNTNCPAPPTIEACATVATGPVATNQNSEGWTFSETRATGHNEFVANGLRVWTESNGSTDKAAGYKAASFDLADLGTGFGLTAINNGAGATGPALQLLVDLDADSSPEGYLVYEPGFYGTNNVWLSSNWTSLDISGAPTAINGGGTGKGGSVNDWLVAFPNATVSAIGYSLGSGVLGDWTITSIVAGCTTYGFAPDDTYPTPSTVNVDDSQIFPIEDIPGWGDGYGHSPRSYFTAADGAHIGNGHATQLINTFPTMLETSELEALITGASADVVSGSATFQVAMRYGGDDPQDFTTLRSLSLTATGNHFSSTDKWVSSRDILNSSDAIVVPKNTPTSIADLVAALYAQGSVKVQGVAMQADSAAVVQDLVFNGTKYHFVPTAAGSVTNHVVVPEADIDTFEAGDGSNYTNWHEGYANASKSFSVDGTGLNLGDPSHSQILKGLETAIAGTDLYAMLTSQAGVTVESGTVTYQVAFTHDGAIGWGTLRSASLSAGSHTFTLADSWMSSKAIGASIAANTAYPLGDILDALVAEGNAKGTAFGVQADNAAHISSITFGDTEYSFANPAGTTCGPPDFGNGKYEVHLGRGLEERNQPPLFNINSFGGLVDADDPSDTFAEIQGYGTGWTNTYIRTVDEPGNDFSNGYVITYTFVDMIVTGTVTVGNNGCNSLVWTYTDTQIVAGIPTISGTATVGQTLTADAVAAGWTPASGVTFGYQWKANGTPIVGATSSTYELTAAELGKTITVEVTGSKTNYKSASNTSLGTAEVLNDHVVVDRLWGANRYATAVEISQQHTSATRVYIANGVGYADALSAGPAAAHFDAPLLLTPPNALPAIVISELNRLQPSEIVIVGGDGVVSPAVKTALENLSFSPEVRRVAGSNRYATSRAIATDTWGEGSLGTAYLATGTDFPDALSAAPAAAHFDGPVVLVRGMATSVDAATLAVLSDLGVDEIKIAGGTGVVSAQIQSQMEGLYPGMVTRNGGSNRYSTSVAINADEFTSNRTVYLAQGSGFPDALAGAALAGAEGAPLFISQTRCIPQAVVDAITNLGADRVVLLGGTGVLDSAVENLTTCGS